MSKYRSLEDWPATSRGANIVVPAGTLWQVTSRPDAFGRFLIACVDHGMHAHALVNLHDTELYFEKA